MIDILFEHPYCFIFAYGFVAVIWGLSIKPVMRWLERWERSDR